MYISKQFMKTYGSDSQGRETPHLTLEHILEVPCNTFSFVLYGDFSLSSFKVQIEPSRDRQLDLFLFAHHLRG